MMGTQRRDLILEQLRQDGTVYTADLVKKLQVSSETIRKDLDYLEKEGRLADYLRKDQTTGRAVIEDELATDGFSQARRAVLEYRIVQVYKNMALADIRIETGRFHQIRAQMAHAGTPILGDRKYGNRETEEMTKAFRIQYPALCAYNLEFVHPVSNEKMQFQIKPRGQAFSFFSQL